MKTGPPKRKAGIFAVLYLLILPALPGEIFAQEPAPLTLSEVREIITQGNIEWGRARVAFDTAKFHEMLAPDFYVSIWGSKYTKEQFIESISHQYPDRVLTRFDATVLTVQKKDDEYIAIIHEKIEHDTPKGKIYALWITKDGWKQSGDRWIITFSEAIGRENWWEGVKPPFPDW